MLPSSLCTDMLEDNPGIFLLGQHYEKITNVLHAMPGNLFSGGPCTSAAPSGRCWAPYQQAAGRHAVTGAEVSCSHVQD